MPDPIDPYVNPLSQGMSFFTPQPAQPVTFEGLKARRDMLAKIMAGRRQGYAKNIGEGLQSVGQNIGDYYQIKALDEQDRMLQKQREGTSAAAVTNMGAANPLPASSTPAGVPGASTDASPPAVGAAVADLGGDASDQVPIQQDPQTIDAGRNRIALASLNPSFTAASGGPASTTPTTLPASDTTDEGPSPASWTSGKLVEVPTTGDIAPGTFGKANPNAFLSPTGGRMLASAGGVPAPDTVPGNPPIVMPNMQVAQALPGGLKTRPAEVPPSQVPQGGPTARVRDLTMPQPPAPTPYSKTELDATYRQMATDDPVQQATWGRVIAAEQAKRALADEQKKLIFQNQLTNTLKQQEAATARSDPKYIQELQQKADENARRDYEEKNYGMMGAAGAKEFLNKSWETVKGLPAAARSIEMAKFALEKNPQMMTGPDAEIKLGLSRLMNIAGMPLDPRVTSTEAFQAYIAGVYGALRTQVTGTGTQSDADLRTLKAATASNIKLTRGTIESVLDAMQRLNTPAYIEHNKAIVQAAGTDMEDPRTQNNWRALRAYRLPQQLFIPEEAIDKLRKNPSLAPGFNEKYGLPGLAEGYLGAE